MDYSPAWRRIAFAVIVCVLLALGAYLIGPFAHRDSQKPGRSAGPPPSGATPRPQRTATPRTSPSPAASASQADIYEWLPFSQAGLMAAAAMATRFGQAYGTYSYTQSPAAYGATLQAEAAPALVHQIENAYAAPGVASARASGKQVATGAATITGIRAFGPSSLTFVVQVAQKLTATSGTSSTTTGYAVTLTGSGTSWQVTSVELATVGNS